jgi:hypothetical protein
LGEESVHEIPIKYVGLSTPRPGETNVKNYNVSTFVPQEIDGIWIRRADVRCCSLRVSRLRYHLAATTLT